MINQVSWCFIQKLSNKCGSPPLILPATDLFFFKKWQLQWAYDSQINLLTSTIERASERFLKALGYKSRRVRILMVLLRLLINDHLNVAPYERITSRQCWLLMKNLIEYQVGKNVSFFFIWNKQATLPLSKKARNLFNKMGWKKHYYWVSIKY